VIGITIRLYIWRAPPQHVYFNLQLYGFIQCVIIHDTEHATAAAHSILLPDHHLSHLDLRAPTRGLEPRIR